MGTSYLLDTNTVIYFLDGVLPVAALDFLENEMNENGCLLSVISKIELLGWKAPTVAAAEKVEKFVGESDLVWLDDTIVSKAIEIRKAGRVRLPDAVIAATAIIGGLTLVSRNDDDFRRIAGLKYLNPFTDI